MPKPRPTPRIDVCNVTARLNPLNQRYQDTENFKQGRFQYYAPTHGAAVAIGSTKLYSPHNNSDGNGEIHISDASTVVYNRGENGERTDVLIALADGCNISDENKNISNGLVAKAACDYITQEAKPSDDGNQLITKIITAGKKSLEVQRNPDDQSSSTLNAAVINFNKGSFVNVGDGLLIVLDGSSGQVKRITTPTQILKNTDQYVTVTAQELHQINNPQLYLDINQWPLQAGDIVILASRGLAEVLPVTKTKNSYVAPNTTHAEKINYIEYKIQIDALNNIFLKVLQNVRNNYSNSKAPAFAIANELVNFAIELSHEQNQKKISFAKDTETLLRQFKTQMVDQQNKEYRDAVKKIRAEIAANFKAKKSQELKKPTETIPEISLELSDDNLKENTDIPDTSETKIDQAISSDAHAVVTATLRKISRYSNKTPEELQSLTISILKWSTIFFPAVHTFIEIFDNPKNVSYLINAVEQLLDNAQPIDKNHLNQCTNLVTQNQTIVNEEPRKILSTDHQVRTNDSTGTDENFISYFAKQFVEKYKQIPKPREKTIKDFKKWILETRGANDEYLRQLNEHLITININQTKAYSFLQNDLDVSKMQFGDDITIAVAYVPDQQLELVRAMIEYPNNRNQLWANLQKTNPSDVVLEQIYHALRCEKYIKPSEKTNIEQPQQTLGQRAEDLSHNIEYSYSEDEILDVEVFLLPKVKLSDHIANLFRQEAGETKETAHEKLKQLINDKDLSVLERCYLYNKIPPAKYIILNKHRHAGLDRFFGIKFTHTWSQTLKEIRDNALAKLRTEIEELRGAGKSDRALALLNRIIEAPLFNTHRSNFKITGAFGETTAVKEIRQLIDSVCTAKNMQSYAL